ncbi:hypothetical protein BOTBODRAFT_177465 [Botryobasidium botryosum FD-172 SS1]|uniref:Acyl-coenzyme A oxidase n=1 Tax=Botryobasidium botryosum (strain FD-172 SS1) TaxID=930990 RepID=A0A067M618_BOTB1|nr:hypothetical protein BOTBODRAFT_177465 [Botryobasidium botryosum FD-172 SS1]
MAANNINQCVRDMKDARERSTAAPGVMAQVLRGKEEWQTRRKISEVMSTDPVFDKSKRPFLSRSESYHTGLANMKRLVELSYAHGWSEGDFNVALSLIDEWLPFNLHATAFHPVIMSQGSLEQVAEYGSRSAHHAIIGCYAQTELGHGSNVNKLETTATYLPNSQEFEIHSPTFTSAKWWIGGLAKTATHAVVQAQLILPGEKNVGPHLFIVQLRSLETHEPLQGISLGDIGPKAFNGFSAVDNGFATFDHVRIPRSAMLSKFAQVTPEGKYVQPPHAKLSFGGMIYIRSGMITQAGWVLAKGATISIRYCTVRRQGGEDGTMERQVITYPSVYTRLLPALAKAYAFILLGRDLSGLFHSMSSRLARGDTSLLAETHAISSGLKAVVTTQSLDALETTRRSMGGHGYSAFAEVGRIWAKHVPSATFEGDNYVLDGQVVRAALKSLRHLQLAGFAAPPLPSSRYLRLLAPGTSRPAFRSDANWEDPSVPVLLLEWKAALLVEAHARSVQSGNIVAGLEHRVALAVTEAFMATRIEDSIQKLASLPPRERKVLNELLLLFLLTSLEAALSDIFAFSLIQPLHTAEDATAPLREAISRICRSLLPEAIALTDAFGFSDWELDSSLGVYDGNVYQALWDRAQEEPLNQRQVVEGYAEFIKPILKMGEQAVRAKKDRAKL